MTNPYAKVDPIMEPPVTSFMGTRWVPEATYDRVVKAFQYRLKKQNEILEKLAAQGVDIDLA